MALSCRRSPFSDRIKEWLAHTPPPEGFEPLQDPIPKRKRKRAMSLPLDASTSRSSSPKRKRTSRIDHHDEVDPGHSASELGRESVLILDERTTFSPATNRVSSNRNRSSSPMRETPIMLRNAQPRIVVESLNGLREAPPTYVERLGDRIAEGIDFAFIPKNLQDVIKGDPDVGHQVFKPADFDLNDTRPAEELLPMWEHVKNIFIEARGCRDGGRDENAWCDDVLRPLMQLAIQLYGDNAWQLQNVQSQSMNPLYLPTISITSMGVSGRRKYVDRKTDYVLSYSHRHPVISALYSRLHAVNRRDIGHTLDAYTKGTALFSIFEVKAASGNHTEAELQMSIGITASLLKKQELAHKAQVSVDLTKMVEPAFTMSGQEHYVYLAYLREDPMDGSHGGHILADTVRFPRLSTDSIRGIFQLLRLHRNSLRYGMDETEDGYWGGFLRPVLEKLAGDPN